MPARVGMPDPGILSAKNGHIYLSLIHLICGLIALRLGGLLE